MTWLCDFCWPWLILAAMLGACFGAVAVACFALVKD